jgi:hypothetical protein
MLANALFVATVIFLALAFSFMGQLRFLIPWRALLSGTNIGAASSSIAFCFYCFLLFTNVCGRGKDESRD